MKLFSASVFSSHSPHLYMTLGSHNPDVGRFCISPSDEKTFVGPSVRLSPGWTDWGYFSLLAPFLSPMFYQMLVQVAPLQVPPTPSPLSTPPLAFSAPPPHLPLCLSRRDLACMEHAQYFTHKSPFRACNSPARKHNFPSPTDVETEAQSEAACPPATPSGSEA